MPILRASVALSDALAGAQLVASRYPNMFKPIIGPRYASVPGSDRTETHRHLVALSVEVPDGGVLYYLRIRAEGRILPWPRGKARSPIVGPTSFSFGFSSCDQTSSNHIVFDAISDYADAHPEFQFFAHLGDHAYRDLSEDDPSWYLFNLSSVSSHSRMHRFHRNQRVLYLTSDHDNDKQSSLLLNDDPARTTLQALFTALEGRNALGFGGGTIQAAGNCTSWQEGRVLIIGLDCRSKRNKEANTDNAGKSMLGTVQKAWLMRLLDYAATNRLAVAIFGDIPWHGGAADDWSVFTTERREIADAIKAKGLAGRCWYMAGDNHQSWIDDGTNSAGYATGGGCPMPQFIASPLDKVVTGQTEIPFTHSHGACFAQNGQFGVVTVTDNGGASIGIGFQGYRVTSSSDATLIPTISYSFTITL